MIAATSQSIGDLNEESSLAPPPGTAELAPALNLRPVEPADAPAVLDVVRAAFAARPQAGPPPAALAETVESITERIATGGGTVATVGDRVIAVVLTRQAGESSRLERVSVLPEWQRSGVATAVLRETVIGLALAGANRVCALVRKEFPNVRAWWERHGFEVTGEEDGCDLVCRTPPQVFEIADADAMRALGDRFARGLRAGDVIIAAGELGAGKTTLTQGIGAGLQVDRPIISPTFVLSRVHPSLVGGPALVHVDAYRLGSATEVDDLDLAATLADSVTLVEWGTNVAEGLSPDRLEIEIERDDPASDTRWVIVAGVGERWQGVRL